MNRKKKQKPRRSIRLQSYDYSSPGEYFVTICIQDRRPLFGDVVDGEMRLNRLGRIAWERWYQIPDRFKNVTLDVFVVMPNHVHGIIGIESNPVAAIHELQQRGANPENRDDLKFNSEEYRKRRRQMLLPKIIGWYKMNVSKQANIIIKKTGNRFWQRNYYEHIIRDDQALNRIRNYIIHNPSKWERDRNN